MATKKFLYSDIISNGDLSDKDKLPKIRDVEKLIHARIKELEERVAELEIKVRELEK